MYQKGKTMKEIRLELNAPNACKRWTETEEEDMIKELQSGLSHEEISQKHGRTIGGICTRLKDIAIKMMKEEGKSLEYVSNFIKMDESEIEESIMKRKNKKSPRKEIMIQNNDMNQIMIELQDIKKLLHNLDEKISKIVETETKKIQTNRNMISQSSYSNNMHMFIKQD